MHEPNRGLCTRHSHALRATVYPSSLPNIQGINRRRLSSIKRLGRHLNKRHVSVNIYTLVSVLVSLRTPVVIITCSGSHIL